MRERIDLNNTIQINTITVYTVPGVLGHLFVKSYIGNGGHSEELTQCLTAHQARKLSALLQCIADMVENES